MSQEIWVVCDNIQKCNTSSNLGIISKAVELGKDIDYRIVAVCMGKHMTENMEELFYYGIDSVLYIQSEETSKEIYYGIIEKAIAAKRPKLIMFPSSEFGRRLAAYTSIDFEAGLTAECIEIEVNKENKLEYKRAAISSSTIVTIQGINCDIEICTIKENVFLPFRYEQQNNIKIETFHYDIEGLQTSEKKIIVLSVDKKTEIINNFSSSKIIFGIGRGIKNKSTVDLLYRVASKVGAEVVGTRAVVEDKLIDQFHQVGQSGISISPDIYVGFGISGASQHMVGVRNSKIIIAVNTDENAPIFEYSDFVIRDDAEAVLKELESQLSQGELGDIQDC